MGDPQVRVQANTGIVSTGDGASITQTRTVYQAPEGGVPRVDQVTCPPGTMHLGAGAQVHGLFVGRQDELAELDAALASGAGVITQALTGLGGIGKSALAREYARCHRSEYNPIWWIPAEDPTEIEAGLARLARRLWPELALLPDEAASAWARTWLSVHNGWLLLLDNVTDPADVAALIADLPGGRFLLTSRATTGWHGIAAPNRLGVLSDGQSQELMQRIAGPALMEGAERLCQMLGNLPLAIEQAAAYMQQNQVRAAVFGQRLSSDGSVLAWSPNGRHPERTIARIWQVSLDAITARHGDLPGSLLRTMAWYAPDDIPISVLRHIEGLDEQHVDEALGRLAAYALITRTGDAIAVHRLVQAVVRDFPTQAGPPQDAPPRDGAPRRTAATSATHALLQSIPAGAQPADWPIWRRLIPHIDTLAALTHPDQDDQDAATLLHHAARFLREQGTLSQAISLQQRAHTGSARLLGPDHPDTLTSRNNLAGAYRLAGDLGRAIPLYQQTLDDHVRVLGPDHPNTLTSRNNLAGAYRSAGDLGRAIPLFQQTLDDHVRVLGPDHPNTLTSRNDLAGAYESAGDLGRAIPLFQQTVDDHVRVLGPHHPDTLTSRNNLAYSYGSAGDLGRAIPLYQQTVDDFLHVLGPEHPDTLTSRNNLAYAYESAGDLGRAIPLFQQTLDDRLRVLGPDHPNTLNSRNNLAQAYESAGDLSRAIPLFQQTLDDRLRLLGPDHPDTLNSRNNLAHAYGSTGDLSRAIPLYQQALDDCLRLLGPDHPLTAVVRSGLEEAAASPPQAEASDT